MCYDKFSFERFVAMLKFIQGLRGGAVEVEVNLHEVNYQIDIRKGRFVETVEEVYAPHEAVQLFFKIFPLVGLHSLYLDKYVFLKTRAILRKDRYQKERELAIRLKLLEMREAALADGGKLYVEDESDKDSEGEEPVEV